MGSSARVPRRPRTRRPTAERPVPPRRVAPGSRRPPALPRYRGPFGRREAERLLWRAGFGPAPGEAEALAGLGLSGAVHRLTRPEGAATLRGPEPSIGRALAPADLHGDDHLAWLDRMVRTDQPLVERMTLLWHDHFATSGAEVAQRLLWDQLALLRRHALGSFRTLARSVTTDPAMLLWLSGIFNRRGAVNENYARELMELFTLGANRGAYTEADVREAARGLTGWRATWTAERGHHDFRFDPNHHDGGLKTVFGRRGAWTPEQVVDLCVDHRLHASFLVTRLWRAFVAEPLTTDDRRALERLYLESGHGIRPVVEAILRHPALHAGGSLVKPPVVQLAGMLRALGRGVEREDWWHWCEQAGQRLGRPPGVAGWDEERWLDTATIRARWNLVVLALHPSRLPSAQGYDAAETPEQAVAAARAVWGDPPLRPETTDALLGFARRVVDPALTGSAASARKADRQTSLRLLVGLAPELLVA